MKNLFMIVIVLFTFIVDTYSLTVQSIKCGRVVQNRTIKNEQYKFNINQKAYCLSNIKDINNNDKFIIHRWIIDGFKYDIKLKIKPFNRFRTWSYKTLFSKGLCKIEILDQNGKLLKERVIFVK